MNSRMFLTPVLTFTALALAGCVSTSSDALRADAADAEVKRLENQAGQILATIKDEEPTTPGEDRILPGDDVTVQVWKRDKTTQFQGFPLVRSVPDSGKMFFPGVGLTEVGGRTDGELQAALLDYFSKMVVDPTIKILSGDEVTIQVWKHDRTTQFQGFPFMQTVPGSGEVFIPGVGLTGVGGKTDGEVQTALRDHFSKILVEPTVIVRHKGMGPVEQDLQPLAVVVSHEAKAASETRSRTGRRVVLMGWVGGQGLYSLEESLTVRDIIAKAGGFGLYANKRHVFIIRGSIQNPDIIIVNVARILVGKDLDKNIVLQPNDAVYVPPIGLWKAYDVIGKLLLPIKAVRETIWETTAPLKP